MKDYLESRIRSGETPGPESAVIAPSDVNQYRASGRFLQNVNVGIMLRHPIRSAGLTCRPDASRACFMMRCLEASSRSVLPVPKDSIETWTGHTSDVTKRHYTPGRADLPDSLVAGMRAASHRCQPS